MNFSPRRKIISAGMALIAVGIISWACMDREPAWTCPVPQSAIRTQVLVGGFDKVDILVVVDNSKSMEEEQVRLSSSFVDLVSSLLDPPQEWQDQDGIQKVDNIRIAVVTTDMGMDVNEDFQGCDSTLPGGDKGRFQTTGRGTNCEQTYPRWLETTPENPAEDTLAEDFSCVASVGTEGCGFELQLFAASYALQRTDQKDFLRGTSALLAIIVISDESDCSAKPGSDFWKHPEMTPTNSDINIYCAKYKDDLIPISDLANNLKKKGDDSGELLPGSVVFAAIVGVPMVDACQGNGATLGDCLNHADMKFVREEDDQGRGYLKAACVSDSIDPDTNEPTTEASPGRRFVMLAEEFDEYGYIYSICNDDWSPAMKEIAKRIAESLAGATFEMELEYDDNAKASKCDVIFQKFDKSSCPSGLVDMGIIEDQNTGKSHRECKVKPIPHPKQCKAAEDLSQNKPGWIYCEASDKVKAANPKYGTYNVLLNDEAKKRTMAGGNLWVECLTKAEISEGLCPE